MLLDIKLTASESNWRLFMLRKADKAFRQFQEKIFVAQGYTCQYCGFQSQVGMDVVNIDGNYLNNKKSNMATCCALCAQCFFIESVGNNFGGGSLIMLPEMTQAQLNAMCHVLFAQMLMNNNMLTSAKNVYRGFKLRAQIVEKQLGEGLSNPSTYGRVLIESTHPDAIYLHTNIMQQVRLLPAIDRFTPAIQQWAMQAIAAME